MNLEDDKVWEQANQNNRNKPTATKKHNKIDKAVSEIVGRNVLAIDPVLLTLLADWKKKIPAETETIETPGGKEVTIEKPVNILENKDFIKVLKETFV
jgi:hypothetical protein